jgi:hypothetical protein
MIVFLAVEVEGAQTRIQILETLAHRPVRHAQPRRDVGSRDAALETVVEQAPFVRAERCQHRLHVNASFDLIKGSVRGGVGHIDRGAWLRAAIGLGIQAGDRAVARG